MRERERFLYHYDFFDNWQIQLRVEKITSPEARKSYPRCIQGKRAGPPQSSGGPWAFQSHSKAKRRLFELLKSQGMQMNQQVTFLSDGGDLVRDLQLYLNPQAEHLLDWFHITMRITVLGQYLKGVKHHDPEQGMLARLESIKWYLWHGNVFQALQNIQFLEMDTDCLEMDYPKLSKMAKAIREFRIYIENNQSYIPNYGDRYRYGERISTGFVESTVNQVIAKRMEKRQQMRWTPRGAHLLLQVRTKVLNQEWRKTFKRWYPNTSQFTEMPVAA